MLSEIRKIIWLQVHSEKRVLALLFLEIVILVLTVVLSLQLFGVRQYHIQQSIDQTYYRVHVYPGEGLTAQDFVEIQSFLGSGYGTITVNDQAAEEEGFTVSSVLGKDPGAKVYGSSLEDISAEDADSSVVVPEEYFVVHSLKMGDTKRLGDRDFRVVGINGGSPNTAFLITPSALIALTAQIREMVLFIPSDITQSAYREILTNLQTIVHGGVAAEDYQTEISSIASGYSVYSFAVFMLGVINLMFIQQHIQNKKKRFFAIMQLTGATPFKLFAVAIAEVILAYSVGFAGGALLLYLAQSIYRFATKDSFYLLYMQDYVAFYLMYLVGFAVPALFSYRRCIHAPQILVYKEGE